eukprot:gene4019-2873_t
MQTTAKRSLIERDNCSGCNSNNNKGDIWEILKGVRARVFRLVAVSCGHIKPSNRFRFWLVCFYLLLEYAVKSYVGGGESDGPQE